MAGSGKQGLHSVSMTKWNSSASKKKKQQIPQGTRNNKLDQAKDTNVSTTDAILAALQVATLAATPPAPLLLLSLPLSFILSFTLSMPSPFWFLHTARLTNKRSCPRLAHNSQFTQMAKRVFILFTSPRQVDLWHNEASSRTASNWFPDNGTTTNECNEYPLLQFAYFSWEQTMFSALNCLIPCRQ